MKKLIVALIVCGVTYGALAQVTQTSEAVDVFTPPHAFRDTIIPAHNKAVVDLAAVIAQANATKVTAETAVAGDVLTAGATADARVATVTVESSIESANQIVGWWSETAGGAAEDTSLVSVVAGANTAVLSDSESPTVVFTTHTTGVGILTITVDADVTRYFNVVQRNGVIVSTEAIELAE